MPKRSWRHPLAVVCAATLLTAGCSAEGDDADPEATATAGAPTSADAAGDGAADEGRADGADGDVDVATAPSSTTPTEGPLADAIFLTAVDDVLVGTVHEGLVDAVPGEFLLTATLVCERLAEGRNRTDVLGLYLEALGAGEPSEDDARLAGALVGASIEVYCPGHFR